MILDESRPPSNSNNSTAPPQDADSLTAPVSRISSQLTLQPQDPPQDPRTVLATDLGIETAGGDDSLANGLEDWANRAALRTDTVVQPTVARGEGATGQPPQRMQNPTSSANANTNSPPRSFLNGKLIPRDEDVIWCLEVLAFLSKYAYLRDQLQQTHLVPNLSTRSPTDPLLNSSYLPNYSENNDNDMCAHSREQSADLMDIDEEPCSGFRSCSSHSSSTESAPADDPDHWDYENYDFEIVQDIDDEFKGAVQNIFPLVEQFTARQFSEEMKYWAGAIMRNSCRKDESKGGVRQCANFECGRWEEFPRQFAKCRRCKRTKYCSKNCQFKGWNYHRHWCASPNQSGSRSVTSASSTSTNVAMPPTAQPNQAQPIQPQPNLAQPNPAQPNMAQLYQAQPQLQPQQPQPQHTLLQPPQQLQLQPQQARHPQ